MAGKTASKRIQLFLILLTSIILLSAVPFFTGPGLSNPEPIGKYLNGVFPETQVSQKPYKVTFPNLVFDNPIAFKVVPNQNKIVLAQLDGKIFWFDNDQNTTMKTSLLDLSNEVGLVSDGGFLGLTMHPNFGTAGSNFFYVYYATKDSAGNNFPTSYTVQTCDSEEYWGNFLILERFEVDPQSLSVVANSRVNLIKIRMYGTTHRGGGLEFGDDGFLYLTMGDQTAWKKSQDIANNLDGGILRIDVDKDPAKSHAPIRTMPEDHGFAEELTGNEYWIPNDNPFLSPDGSNFEEYYGLGLRNPHRMTKDMETGTFYLGDVGLSTHEEINVLSKGKNYGWPVFEGNMAGPNCLTQLYNNMPHEEALVVFEEVEANSIIGGYVYRGTEIPELYGKYICADYGYGDEVWSVDTDTGDYHFLGNFLPRNVISFGQDAEGEIYILKLGQNVNLYQLSSPEISYSGIPQNLSETGAFEDLSTLSVSDGLIPYELVESFWSDGALKKRWMAIPNDGTHNTPDEVIDFSENGIWDFPDGTVLIKHFELAIDDNNPTITKKIETRFSIKGADGNFYFLTYNWNDAETDATLQEVGVDESVAITTSSGGTRYQNWRYPSNTECISCHSNATKDGLGLRTRYLNTDHTYDETNITANQLVTLSHLGILNQTITDNDTPNFLTSKSIYDSNATIDEKARSYLDLNCAYCHRPSTGNRAQFDLRLINSLAETGLLTAGTITSLGIEGEKIVVPGDASKSILYHRMNSLDSGIMMPPLAKSIVDDDAVTLIAQWINQLGGSTNLPPVAVVTASPISGTVPLDVSFIGNGSTDDNGIANYFWDFGDGNSSTEIDPVHTFTTVGDYTVSLTVTDTDGLSHSQSTSITVNAPNQPPVAVVTASPISGAAPLQVSFTGSNSTDDYGIANYFWDFGDGNSSTEIDPVHTFTTAGNYAVSLTVTDTDGLSDTKSTNIMVDAPNQPPVAVVTASPISGTAPLDVSFTGNGSTDDNGISYYFWDFGDGNSSTEIDPVHTFTTIGNHTVNLTVTDTGGLSDTTSTNIVVDAPNQPPVAVVTASPISGVAPLEVSFTGSNSTDDNGIVNYFWDFGDGRNSSTEIDPVHTFTTAGNFTVNLTVTDAEGLSDSNSTNITVIPPNQPPVAVISTGPISEPSLEVYFTGSNSTDDHNIVSYFWDFGDGHSSTEINPVHTFEAAGEYTVYLTVTDVEGLYNTTSLNIMVTAPNQPPVAVVVATPISENPLAISFSANNSTDDQGIAGYFWDFGDGYSSTERDLVHAFADTGTYSVQLKVIDNEGLFSINSMSITVTKPNQSPVAVAVAEPISEDPLTIRFDGQGSTDDDGIVGYFWDFGDGHSSTEINPVHTFEAAGTYSVELAVMDADGLTHSITLSITIDAILREAMIVMLQENPPQQGKALIQIRNKPTDLMVHSIYLYDRLGRLVKTFNTPEFSTNSSYEFQVATLNNGLYFAILALNEGDPIVLKVLVRN